MEWWDRVRLNPQVKLNAVSAQHFSGRSLHDRDHTLWCGYVLEAPVGNIYFAGDTGMGKFIDLIGERWPEFRLALLPIGAFKPEWFMSRVHISPEQALQIHNRLKVQTSVGIHFGTFKLADDHQDEPIQTINRLVTQQIPTPDFRVLEFGESVRLN